ncbi:hypothetical protein [Stutzerimonas nitrititolerans]|nr:hypothetical protein [Stutzerimonas nitrititolerans]
MPGNGTNNLPLSPSSLAGISFFFSDFVDPIISMRQKAGTL